MFLTVVFVELIHDLDDATFVLGGCHGSRERQEQRRQYSRPVDAHLPRTTFVREEDHVVVALINVAQQAQNDLDGLSNFSRAIL